jgi:hypothetical protein
MKPPTPRSHVVRRRVVLGAVLTSATLPATGCGPEWAPGVVDGHTRAGSSADNGSLLLRNIFVVSAVDGIGSLMMTIINETDANDALVAVQMEDGEASIHPRPSIIPGLGMTVYGVDTSQTTDPDTIVVRGDPVVAGYYVQLTSVFERSAPIETAALVKRQAGPYRSVPVPTRPAHGRSTSTEALTRATRS